MSINQKIDQIVSQRAAHLPYIESELKRLDQIESAISDLDKLTATVRNEMAEGKGSYYTMLAEDPKMERAFNRVDSTQVTKLIREQRDRLENLRKRFSRSTVCIAMIGYERQGKSTFLQAISGLNNKVIPAYSGTSCTGAVSVIHNTEDQFHADITFYTPDEFIAIVNEKLSKYFPGQHRTISSVADIAHLDLSGFQSNDMKVSTEFEKFRNAYVGHQNEYAPLLGHGTLTFYNEDDIIRHVAQYEEFDTPPEGEYTTETNNDQRTIYKKFYYRYLAVKNVHIYKKFELIDSKRIELVDTIGMGDSSDSDRIKEEMFRVLHEDCDAAVNLFKPDAMGGGFNAVQVSVLQEISDRLKQRDPSKWIVYVINKIASGRGYNLANIPAVIKAVESSIQYMDNKPVAWVKAVDGSKSEEIRLELINPLLDLITTNLPQLDEKLMADANEGGNRLGEAFYTLINNVESVVSGSAVRGTNEGRLFDKLFDDLETSSALRRLDEDNYAKQRKRPCAEIEQAISAVIDSLYDTIPDPAEIEKEIDKGVKGLIEIFDQSCDDLRTGIVRAFEGVSDDVINPLRDKAKCDVATILFNEGKLGRIPLKGYSVKDGPSLEWLKCLVTERIKSDAYPQLANIFNYLLNYDFTIKYTIEYDVTSSLGMIDKMNPAEYVGMSNNVGGSISDRAMAIVQELVNRIPHLQQKLTVGKDRFALIPGHSFWALVNNFRTDLTRGRDTRSDLREFYRDNAYSIWRDEFNSIVDQQQAFGRWNEVSGQLSSLYSPDAFTIK